MTVYSTFIQQNLCSDSDFVCKPVFVIQVDEYSMRFGGFLDFILSFNGARIDHHLWAWTCFRLSLAIRYFTLTRAGTPTQKVCLSNFRGHFHKFCMIHDGFRASNVNGICTACRAEVTLRHNVVHVVHWTTGTANATDVAGATTLGAMTWTARIGSVAIDLSDFVYFEVRQNGLSLAFNITICEVKADSSLPFTLMHNHWTIMVHSACGRCVHNCGCGGRGIVGWQMWYRTVAIIRDLTIG